MGRTGDDIQKDREMLDKLLVGDKVQYISPKTGDKKTGVISKFTPYGGRYLRYSSVTIVLDGKQHINVSPRNLTLIERKQDQREGNKNYFKNGKPKKSSMLCKDKGYLALVRAINGPCRQEWICAGNCCLLYATGCDNQGQDWN